MDLILQNFSKMAREIGPTLAENPEYYKDDKLIQKNHQVSPGIVLTKNAKQLVKAVNSLTRRGSSYTTNNACLGRQDQGNLPLYLLKPLT